MHDVWTASLSHYAVIPLNSRPHNWTVRPLFPARESSVASRFSLDNERAGDDDQRDLVVRDQTLTGTSVAGDVCACTAKCHCYDFWYVFIGTDLVFFRTF